MQSLQQQLLAEIKHRDCWVNGAELERMVWKNNKNNPPTTYKPGVVNRELRRLEETMPNRIKKELQGRARSIAYRYLKSDYEKYNDKMQGI